MMKYVLYICLLSVILIANGTASDDFGKVASSSTNQTTLKTQSGMVYNNYKFTRSEPDGITISHSKGIAKISFKDLPNEFVKNYNYDPLKADEYAREMETKRATYAEDQKRAAKELEIVQAKADKDTYFIGACRSCGGRGTLDGLRRADGNYSQLTCVTCRGSGRTKQSSKSGKSSSSSSGSSASSTQSGFSGGNCTRCDNRGYITTGVAAYNPTAGAFNGTISNVAQCPKCRGASSR